MPLPGSPSSLHIVSTLSITAWSMRIGRPHSRLVSPGHLSVASRPILEPRPLTGLAKSTVHGHLLVLRTGGLAVADASKKGGYSLRREMLAESAALLETYLEGTEE